MTPALTIAWAARRLRRILRILPEVSPQARQLNKKAGPRGLDASVLLVSAARMQNLNRRYRGKNRPTDVLSFEAPAPFQAQGFLGELVICSTVARAQARAHGHSPRQELDILLVHGVLHLLGMDHERGARLAAAMRRAEVRVLARLSARARAGLIDRAARGKIKAG